METEQEFIQRRQMAHQRAREEAERDVLCRELFGPHERVELTTRERAACQTNLTRRQAI